MTSANVRDNLYRRDHRHWSAIATRLMLAATIGQLEPRHGVNRTVLPPPSPISGASRHGCGYLRVLPASRAEALAPWLIGWGADASSDMLRRAAANVAASAQ